MPMFVLLEHETSDGTHWDFMMEQSACQSLATWRLSANPFSAAGGHAAAERIADHRRAYLDYEGEISGNRGRVRRLDRGQINVNSDLPHSLTADLRGQLLRGTLTITNVDPRRFVFVPHT